MSKKAKMTKIAAKPKPVEPFVTQVSNILGFDDEHNCIRLKNGFAAVIRVPGIDIVNYKPSDQEFAYRSYGIALQQVACAHKIVFVSDKANYTEQIHYLQKRLENTTHPYLRYILSRHIGWLHSYERTQSDRIGYILFFSDTVEEANSSANQYMAQLRWGKNPAMRCDREQCIRLLQIFNKVVMDSELEITDQ